MMFAFASIMGFTNQTGENERMFQAEYETAVTKVMVQNVLMTIV